MSDSNPSRPCGHIHPTATDPHAATYCTLEAGHDGQHHSALKNATWEER